MKKSKYIFILFSFLYLFVLGTVDVNAVTLYNCTNAGTDTCTKREYKYSKDGSSKNFSITLGVFHYKNSNPNNENLEYVKSFDGCDAIQSTTNCSVDGFRFYADKLTIAVDSNKDYFPIAICAIPYLNSQPLNQALGDHNVRNYMYFSESEVDSAISSGYCTENNVYYTELNHTTTDNVAKVCINKTSLHNFTSDRNLTGATIQTNLYNTGNTNICNINAVSGSDRIFIFNHNNSDKLCTASSYDITCTGSGTYNCTLNLCGNASSATVQAMVGKKCYLYNENNSSDVLEYSYTFSKADRTVHSNVLKQNDSIITKPVVPGNDSSFALSASCPDYIYYDKTVDKYYILTLATKALYDQENPNNNVVSYRFTNSSNMDILEEDEVYDQVHVGSNGEINWGDPVEVNCEGIIGDELLDFINKIFRWIQIIAPIIVIVLGGVEFGGAVLQDDKDALKKASTKFVKRLIIAVALFFIPLIVSWLLTIFNEITGAASSTCGIGG